MEKLSGVSIMKKILIFIAMLFLIVGVSSARSAGLSIEVTKYEPYPAEPGKYLDVWLKIENVGGDPAENVMIQLSPQYPFSFDSNEDGFRDIGTILGGREVILKFKVRVDENAVQGDNYLDVAYKYGSYDWLTKRINIFVQTHDSILSIEKTYTLPEILVPGKISKIIFELENMADSFLSNINIKLDLTNSSLPFAPINSTTEKRIYLIESGKIEKIEFNVITSSDAKSGIYKIPVEISYYDSTGADYVRNDIIGVTVGDKPKFNIYLDESEILKAGESGIVKLIVVNSGLTDLRFLNIKLLDSDNFEKLTGDKIYIGDLDSDDTDTVEFKLYVKPTNAKEVILPFEVNYFDNNNNEYVENIDVGLKLYTSSEINRYGLKESTNYAWVVGLIIIGIVGYLVYNYYWKRK